MTRGSGSATEERKRIGDILVADGILTPDQLDEALEKQREDPNSARLGTVVLELGMVSEHAVARALARQLRLPMVDLVERTPSPEAIEVVPRRLAERHDLLPLDVDPDEGILTVAMSDPTDVFALDDLRTSTGLRHVRVQVATESALDMATKRAYDADSAASKVVERLGGDDVEVEDLSDIDLDVTADATESGAEEPVIQLVNALLADAVRSRASDVHVEPERLGVRVRYRIDGMLREVQDIPRRLGPAVTSRLKIMSSLDIAERRRPQDGRAMIRVAGQEVDLRVSTMPTMYGETIVLRLLRKGAERLDIDDLGFDAEQEELYLNSISRSQGLVVLTGPTGSGKTTSLYAGLGEIVDPEINIVTLEDPVEYQVSGVNQTQVNPRVGLTFASGLRTILRQDPDVVMVGEVRDTETAQLAVEASFTGHLVLSTLHTNDAPSTVARMVELGVERFLLATTLLLVVAQRLGRRICEQCAAPAPAPEDRVLEQLGLERSALEDHELMHGEGCSMCSETGYLGRIGFYEMLRMTPRMRQLVSDGGNELQIGALARAQGMRSLREDAIAKALAGVTTLDEVLRTTPEDQMRSDQVAAWQGGDRDGDGDTAVVDGDEAVIQPRALVLAEKDEADKFVAALPEGWRSTIVDDVESAIEQAASDRPDAVLVGHASVPEPLSAANRLRAVVDRDVLLLLCSSEELADGEREEATLAGVDDVVIADEEGTLGQLLTAILPVA